MKFLVVLALAAAVTSASPVYEKTAFLKDLPPSPVLEGRITNGKDATVGLFPYQAGLLLHESKGTFWCGGSLIGKTWILTAAHCTNEAYEITVYLGSVIRFNGNQYSATIQSKNFHQHPSYSSKTLDNDVSLLQIPAVSYSNYIQPIKLPSLGDTSSYAGVSATVSGWGSSQNHLQYVSVKVISNTECADYYGQSGVNANNLCVAVTNGQGPCHGDSGGPLAVDNNELLIGVLSFVAAKGCESGGPAGFQRVTRHLEWIRGVTGIAYN